MNVVAWLSGIARAARMGTCAPVALGALLLAGPGPWAIAQGLDLTPPPPVPTPQELSLPAAAVARLDLDLTRLRLARQAATGRQVMAVDAMIAARELARATCESAASSGWGGLDGALRLVEALPAIDARIRALLLAQDVAAGDAALGRLAALAPAAPADSAPQPTPPRSTALAALLLALDGEANPDAGWPLVDAAGTPMAPRRPPTAKALATRLAALQPAGPLAERLAALTAALDAAEPNAIAPVDLRQAVGWLLDLLEALAASGIVDRQRRDAFEAHMGAIAQALEAARSPNTGDAGDPGDHRMAVPMARESGESAAVLRAADAARSALGEGAKALTGLPALLLRLDTQVAPDATPPPWRAKRAVADLLARVAEGRGLAVDVKGPDLADVRRTLLVDCRQTEKSLLDSLATLIEAASPQADPAMSSLLRSHQRLVEDLRWLGSIEELATRLATRDGAVDAGVREGLSREMLDIARGLADPSRRPDALQARIQLERQAAAFERLPGEAMGPGMVELLGAERAAAMRTFIAAARWDWVTAWSKGEGGGAAARRMLTALRLMRCAEAVAMLREPAARDAVTATLSRWSGWSVPAEAIARLASEDATPLIDVLATLRSGEPTVDDVRGIERRTALLRLAIRFSGDLATSLGSSSSPAASALGPLAEPAPDDAWALEHLEALSRVAVLARAWLTAGDEGAVSGPLRAALDWESDALLQRLGEWRGPIPTLR